MDRLGRALEQSAVDPQLRIRGVHIKTATGPRPVRKVLAHWYRWVDQPLSLRHLPGDVFHLVDHSDAHLLRTLPASRTVVTCHDLLLLRGEAGELPYAGRRWWGTRFRWTVAHLAQAGAVACPSEATRADVLRFCDVEPDRIHVIPQGVAGYFRPPTAGTRAATRLALGPGDAYVILQVVSGGFYKNNKVALGVLAALRDRGFNVVMVRVGVPLSQGERTIVERLRLGGKVVEKGWVREEELVDLYGSADVLLFPSTGEGFGWPPLEAMACGLPVVVSSTPALTELTGDAARRARPDDVMGLADQVGAVFDDPSEAARMRQAGLDRASAHTWDRTLRAYAVIYHALAGQGRGLRTPA